MKKIKLYAGRVYTGPGRSHWENRLTPFSAYAQVQRVFVYEALVEGWFAQLIEECNTVRGEMYLIKCLADSGLLPKELL